MKCLWLCMSVIVQMKPSEPGMHRGGAVRARPETRRMLSGIRQAAPCRPRSRLIHLPLFRALRPDCSGRGPDRPRNLRLAGVPARTLAARRCLCVSPRNHGGDGTYPANHVRHRPVPAPAPRSRLAADAARHSGPVAGFARPVKNRPPASGTLMASASPACPPSVWTATPEHFLPPGSKRSRSIRQRERGDYGMGVEGVDEMGGRGPSMEGF